MEKGILFSAPMVQAIQNTKPNTWPPEPIDPGKPFKWQTRRLIKPQPEGRPMYCYAGSNRKDIGKWHHGGKRYTPPCHGDDILWVRETWCGHDGKIYYKASDTLPVITNDSDSGDEYTEQLKWRPSLHMPRAAARIFLRVKDVRVERVQDITEEDARAEGCEAGFESHGDGKFEDVSYHEWTAKDQFVDLWNSIYSKPIPLYEDGKIVSYYSCPWDNIQETRTYKGKPWVVYGNPWVWVEEFERVTMEGVLIA